jgi:hypothetical protein
MAYKLIGLAVWRGARWYLRRRYGAAPRRLGAVAMGVLAAAGAVAARRRAESAEGAA